MKSLTIELTQEELACLLFWHSNFKKDTVEKALDKKLFEKLMGLYDDMGSVINYRSIWSPLPKYQPGDSCSVDEQFWPPVFLG